MDNSLLVQIFVNTGDANGDGHIATGYPVAPKRVMTAYHALYPDGQTPQTVELRWYHQSDAAGKWQAAFELNDDSLIWSDKTLDVALLVCDFPVENMRFAPLSEQVCESDQRWESEGFPAAGKRDDMHNAVGLKGGTYRDNTGERKDWLELGVDDKAKEPKLWRGASGSPVFSHGKIIGVIHSYPKQFAGDRFHATPMWRLLKIPKFWRQVYGEINEPEEKAAKWCWARQEICLSIKNNSQVLESLHTRLNIQTDASQANISKEAFALADALLNRPLERSLVLLNEIRIQFQKANEAMALQRTREILNTLLPALFDCRLNALVRHQKQNFVEVCLNPAIATTTAAEILMAGADNRSTAFILETAKSLPFGVYNRHKSLPLPGTIEIGPDSKQQHLNNFHQQMIDEFAISEGESQEFLIEEAKLQLEHFAVNEYQQETRYCTYKLPDGDAERRIFQEIVQDLQQTYQHLVFIELDADNKRRLQESRQMFPIRDMLDPESTAKTDNAK